MSSHRTPCHLHDRQGLDAEYLKGQGVRIFSRTLKLHEDDNEGLPVQKKTVLLLCDACIRLGKLAFVEAERIGLPKVPSKYVLPLYNEAREWLLLEHGKEDAEHPDVGFLMVVGSISDQLRLRVIANPAQLGRLIVTQNLVRETSTHQDISELGDRPAKIGSRQESSLFVSPCPSQAPEPGHRAFGAMPPPSNIPSLLGRDIRSSGGNPATITPTATRTCRSLSATYRNTDYDTIPTTSMHSTKVINPFHEEPSTSDGTEGEIAEIKARLALVRKERREMERARVLRELEREEEALQQEKDREAREADIKPEIIDLTMKSE